MPSIIESHEYRDIYSNDITRTYFGKIAKGVKTTADSLEAGVFHSVSPKKITLQLLIEMTVYLGVEVGIFINDNKIGLARGREGAIVIPLDCRIIAHSHPTTTDLATQISGDMRRCGDQVEIAVNIEGLVMYYSEGHCYNERGGASLTKRINFRETFKPGYVALDREITVETLVHLGSWRPLVV